MNPHQKNKVDISSLSPEEQRLFRLYGKLPTRSDHFAKHLKERKYFDSGDYAMSKAGKGDGVDTGSVGSQHPVPENIPHLHSPVGAHVAVGPNGVGVPVGGAGPVPQLHLHRESSSGVGAAAGAAPGLSGSPVKDAPVLTPTTSNLNRETSAEEVEDVAAEGQKQQQPAGGGIPIRS